MSNFARRIYVYLFIIESLLVRMFRKAKLKWLFLVCFIFLSLCFLSLVFYSAPLWMGSSTAADDAQYGGVGQRRFLGDGSFVGVVGRKERSTTTVKPKKGLKKPISSFQEEEEEDDRSATGRFGSEMVLSVVACGDRLNDTLVLVKSAVALTTSPMKLIIVADDHLSPKFRDEFLGWPKEIRSRVRISIRPLEFPGDGSADEWKNLFKLCASQRLFFPSLLRDVDATLYVDTDVVFLRPVDDIWRFFGQMNASHLAAMAPENEDFATGWYNRFAQHPFYRPLGVNSGVMLMNLTRIRAFDWEWQLVSIYKKYKQKITWGDQDLLNILFHKHSDKLFVYPCEWNYRTDHCMYASVCKSAEKNGVAVAHGSRNVFHNNKQPTFRVLFETFQKYVLGQDLRTHLLEPLRRNLQQTAHTNCGKIYPIFLKALQNVV